MKSKTEENKITLESKKELLFEYNEPPLGETIFNKIDYKKYNRKLYRFLPSNHISSYHNQDMESIYEGNYIKSTYENEFKIKTIFNRIINLPNNKSDNFGRFNYIKNYYESNLPKKEFPDVLDIGSGLGVFPYLLNKNNWKCTALDPDHSCVKHIKNNVGVETICGDFLKVYPTKKYDIITLNKVLEHIIDPVIMLKKTKDWLKKNGFIYIELPDGEEASKFGSNREEFFIEHYHAFSVASTAILVSRSGFKIIKIERLKEPQQINQAILRLP